MIDEKSCSWFETGRVGADEVRTEDCYCIQYYLSRGQARGGLANFAKYCLCISNKKKKSLTFLEQNEWLLTFLLSTTMMRHDDDIELPLSHFNQDTCSDALKIGGFEPGP